MPQPPETQQIGKLLAPKSIAIVGASDKPGPGIDVTKNALVSVEAGTRVYLVNPSRDELFGALCHKDLQSLPEVPDCVAFAVSTKITLSVMKQAADMGVGAAIVLAGGFAESSQADGIGLQKELADIANGAGMALCGPNCIGLADYGRRFFATSMAFLDVDPGNNPRSVALVSQSGGLLIGFVNRAAARRVPLRTFISSGNEAVTGIEDYLEYLLQDPAIRVAGVICEGIRDLDRLCRIGKAARQDGRRIGLLKLGRSERGRLAVRAHTGRIAGNDKEITEALADAGIARVDRPDELLEFCNLAGRAAPPKGRRISTIMVSGGAAAMTCDIADRQGLPFANWSPATIEGLRVLLPEHATVANPLDLTGGTMLHNREAIEKAIRLIAADPETDFLSFVFPLQHSGGSVGLRNLVEFIAGLAPSLGKPLTVVSTNGGTTSGHWAEFGATSTCPILEDAETAFSAFAKWCP